MRVWGVLLTLIASTLLQAALGYGQGLATLARQQHMAGGRLVAKEASLKLRVSDTGQALQALEQIAARFGGQAASSRLWTVEDSGREFLAASLTLRFPVENFEPALIAVRKVALDVLGEAVTGSDHTDEIVNAESRLRSLEAELGRLAGLEKAAQSSEEKRRIEEDLQDVETLYAQESASLLALKQSVEWATVAIELEPFIPTPTPTLTPTPTITVTPQPTGTPTPWNPAQTYQKAVNSLQSTFWTWLCCIVLLGGIVALAFLGRIIRQNRQK